MSFYGAFHVTDDERDAREDAMREAQRHGDSRDRYGYTPTIIGLVLLALITLAVFRFDQGGEPLPHAPAEVLEVMP